jgi:Kef-type K+ transport system membrane component KefB
MEQFLDILLTIREIFRNHLLFGLGVLLIGGFLFGKLAEKVKLPSITGYILAGLILGESVLGLIPHVYDVPTLKDVELEEVMEEEGIESELESQEPQEHNGDDTHHGHGGDNPLGNVTEVALGLIALTIGGEFSLSKLKKTGKAVLIMTLVQLLLSFAFVSLFLWIFGFDLIFSLILGAIASATAPAATVAIIQSLNIKGPFVDYLYGIVALDDAGAVILFGIVFSIATSLLGSVTGETVSAFSIILRSLSEVIFSVIMGIIIGFILHTILSKGTKRNITINERLIISLSILFLSTAIAKSLHLSPLLTNMMLGGTLINLSERNESIFKALNPLAPPIYAAFFAIAGTELDLSIFGNINILIFGVIFVLARALGKYGGVYLGALISKTDDKIRNYLGLCMLPQAGVAIGLSLIIQSNPIMADNPYAVEVVSIVLFSVFINEITGPPISKYGVIKGAGISNNNLTKN